MSLTLRIFIAYFFIVVVASIIFLNVFMSELKPGMRQSAEEALVDTTNLLAEMVAPEFINDPNSLESFSVAVNQLLERKYDAEISSVNKLNSNLRIYITDDKGIVRYDSSNKDVGADYSKWNDVYLTLRGKYGARSTKSDPNDEFSTVMHVGAPILDGDKIIGVLTVAKPNFTVQPYIDIAYRKVFQQGVLLVILSLCIALTIAYLLTRSIRKLVVYADNVSHRKTAQLPKVYESELSNLATSIENMRIELEGKEYVEKYVHALTHELKSPIAAIRGASELLTSDMPQPDQERFIDNIGREVHRMDIMVNRLLALVAVEKQQVLEKLENLDINDICSDVIQSKQVQLDAKQLTVRIDKSESCMARGDGFLLTQAIDNLLQNAIDFAEENSEIAVTIQYKKELTIEVTNFGEKIPDYALSRIFERFYSLPRPQSNSKSSGLGLCFVKQIAELHQGRILLSNTKTGVAAKLSINAS